MANNGAPNSSSAGADELALLFVGLVVCVVLVLIVVVVLVTLVIVAGVLIVVFGC